MTKISGPLCLILHVFCSRVRVDSQVYVMWGRLSVRGSVLETFLWLIINIPKVSGILIQVWSTERSSFVFSQSSWHRSDSV